MKTPPHFARIRWIARCTRSLLSLALVAGTLFWALLTGLAVQLQLGTLPQWADGYLHIGTGTLKLSNGQIIAAHPMLIWAYATLTLGITAYGLLRLWRLMRMYEAGNVFDRLAPNHLSAFAICILLRELLDMVAPLLMSMNDVHQSAGVSVDSGTLYVLLITLLFFLMSRIMAAAYVVADDNERII